MIRLGFSGRSAPSAHLIAEASGGLIEAVRSSDCDVNWGRRRAPGALNPDVALAVNKRLMREAFRDHRVPSPHLYTPEEAWEALSAGDVYGGRLLGRPDFHTRRRGMWLCETTADVERALRGTRRKQPATHFVRWVDELPDEYRVHVFDGKSIRISRKDHDPDDPRKWLARKPEGRKRHIRTVAKLAVEAVGLDFGAVDVLADNETAMVLEVNAAPGLGGSLPRLYAETIIRHMEGET